MRSIFVKHAEWGRIASSQVDYEGRLFGAEVFMCLVIRELKNKDYFLLYAIFSCFYHNFFLTAYVDI